MLRRFPSSRTLRAVDQLSHDDGARQTCRALAPHQMNLRIHVFDMHLHGMEMVTLELRDRLLQRRRPLFLGGNHETYSARISEGRMQLGNLVGVLLLASCGVPGGGGGTGGLSPGSGGAGSGGAVAGTGGVGSSTGGCSAGGGTPVGGARGMSTGKRRRGWSLGGRQRRADRHGRRLRWCG